MNKEILEEIKFNTIYRKEWERNLIRYTNDVLKDTRLKMNKCRKCFYLTKRLAFQAFTNYYCQICANQYRHNNSATPKTCTSCATYYGCCSDCMSEVD